VKRVETIVFGIDSAYLRFLRVALASLSRSCPSPVPITILHEGLSNSDRDQVRSVLPDESWPIEFISVPVDSYPGLTKIDGTFHFSRAAGYRVLAPELLPHCERLLYFDADTLFRADISALLHHSLSGKPVAAVRNPAFVPSDTKSYLIQGKYFDSGTLLIDAAIWRERKVAAHFDQWLTATDALNLPDNDFLNFFFRGEFLELTKIWGFQPSWHSYHHLRTTDPAVVQFAGPRKCAPMSARGLYCDEVRDIEETFPDFMRRNGRVVALRHSFQSWLRSVRHSRRGELKRGERSIQQRAQQEVATSTNADRLSSMEWHADTRASSWRGIKAIGLAIFGHDSAVSAIELENRDVMALSLERTTRQKHDMRFSAPLAARLVQDSDVQEVYVSLQDVSPHRITSFLHSHRALNIKRNVGIRSASDWLTGPLIRHPLSFLAWAYHRQRQHSADNRHQRDWASTARIVGATIGIDPSSVSFVDHHTSHANTAYYFAPPSFSSDCLVVTLDGQGDQLFNTVSLSVEGGIQRLAESRSQSSLPLIYSAVTHYLGFSVSSDEGKTEALASYVADGRDTLIYKHLSDAYFVDENLSITHRPSAGFPIADVSGQWRELQAWISGIASKHSDMSLASGIQLFFEDFILAYLERVFQRYPRGFLAVAGGGFANVKLNRRIFESNMFKDIFVFPAMGDDGASLGALVEGLISNGTDLSFLRNFEMPYYGPSFGVAAIEEALQTRQDSVKSEWISQSALAKSIARDIAGNHLCALYGGRMEFGPRALGHRSILANPTSESIKDDLNLRFKKREWFQPFCPTILLEERERLFVSSLPNRHMTSAFTLRKEVAADLPAITHIDQTARPQFVSKEDSGLLHDLLSELKRLNGYGVVLNTSFNIHGKPIVMTPQDALDDFRDCEIDVLYMENFRITRR